MGAVLGLFYMRIRQSTCKAYLQQETLPTRASCVSWVPSQALTPWTSLQTSGISHAQLRGQSQSPLAGVSRTVVGDWHVPLPLTGPLQTKICRPITQPYPCRLQPLNTMLGATMPGTNDPHGAGSSVIDFSLGRLQPIVQGSIVNDAVPRDELQPEWLPVVEQMVDLWLVACQATGCTLESLYLRGSVARGLAVPGSDVDSIGIVRGKGWAVQRLLQKSATELAGQIELVSKIEVQEVVVQPGSRVEALLTSGQPLPNNFPHAFMLRTQGLLLWGQDLAARIAPQSPGPRLLHTLRDDFERVHANVAQDRLSEAKVVWIAKRALRAAFELSAVDCFTRDLVPCYAAFAQAYPSHAQLAYQVLEACVQGHTGAPMDPSATMVRVEALVDLLEDEYLDKFFSPFKLPTHKAPGLVLRADPEAKPIIMEQLGTLLAGLLPPPSLPQFPSYMLPSVPSSWAVAPLVRAFDWADGQQHAAALGCLEAGTEPILLQNAMRGDLGPRAIWALQQQSECRVRLSPSPTFIYCEEHHPLYSSSPLRPPSRVVPMTGTAFLAHLAGQLPPLFSTHEAYYLQSPWPLPASALGLPPVLARLAVKDPRLWASCPGTVSTLHFDCSPSALGQVAGTKALYFFAPGRLPELRPYPDDHPLRRRARARLRDVVPCSQVQLGQGDLLFFPPLWAHYTESVEAGPEGLVLSFGGRL